jgi:hypothetical protein
MSSPMWGPWPDIYYCLTVTVLLLWGALSDERTDLPFVRVTGENKSPTLVLYGTDRIENDTSSNSSIVACIFFTMGTCLPSRCLSKTRGYTDICMNIFHFAKVFDWVELLENRSTYRDVHDHWFESQRNSDNWKMLTVLLSDAWKLWNYSVYNYHT